MNVRAHGTFEVQLDPQAPGEHAQAANLGRMSIDKRFQGDLEGSSQGEMLTVNTDVEGSACYVALERVSGSLHGRSGSFVLVHRGVMTRGAPHLTITVVPDSGSGRLAGIAGTMAIEIVDGEHRYEFEYTMAETPRRWPTP
jgi:hypothetical protein